MNTFDTLKAHLDAAREQITESDLFLELMREAGVAFRANEAMPREYLRLDSLAAQIFETAALLADDDITKMITTIANEKDEKMTEYRLPKEPREGRLWDETGTEYMKVPGSAMSRPWENQTSHAQLYWPELLERCEYLTDTPPVKVGDKIDNIEQYVELPEKSVVAVAGSSAIWVKREDERWESSGKSELRSDSMATGWPVRTVLRVGGGE